MARVFGPIFITLVFGTITALIAWRQYRVSKVELQLDLFDRRFEVFRRIWEICVDATGAQRILLSSHAETPFADFWPQAHFLFGDDVNELIDELMSKWMTLSNFERELVGDSTVLENSERKQLYHWFHEIASKELPIVFRRYIYFGRIK